VISARFPEDIADPGAQLGITHGRRELVQQPELRGVEVLQSGDRDAPIRKQGTNGLAGRSSRSRIDVTCPRNRRDRYSPVLPASFATSASRKKADE
jgi:hypothetical protein